MNKFQAVVDRRSAVNHAGCWVWQGGAKRGFGKAQIDGVTYQSHWIGWIAKNGAVPEGYFVEHICDCSLCVNPEHLRLKEVVCRNIFDTAFIKSKTIVDVVTGCWNWQLRTNQKGYAICDDFKKKYLVHRVSFELFTGTKIPVGMLACHKCDNPSCVNPGHIFIGTHADNLGDMAAKGRSSRGEKHYNAKLTEKDVAEIRASPHKNKVLAEKFNVSRRLISKTKNMEGWQHVQ